MLLAPPLTYTIVDPGAVMVEYLDTIVVSSPSLTYTIVDPGAVMVEYLDAIVAYGAVGAAGRPVELTGHTPLHANLHTHSSQ